MRVLYDRWASMHVHNIPHLCVLARARVHLVSDCGTVARIDSLSFACTQPVSKVHPGNSHCNAICPASNCGKPSGVHSPCPAHAQPCTKVPQASHTPAIILQQYSPYCQRRWSIGGGLPASHIYLTILESHTAASHTATQITLLPACSRHRE